jgi:hypothetical protein
MCRFAIAVCIIMLVCLAAVSLAEIPNLINYRRMLAESDGATAEDDGTYDINAGV